MKNQKNGSNAPKMHPRAKLPITDPPTVWVCGSPYVDGNAKLVSAVMKCKIGVGHYEKLEKWL